MAREQRNDVDYFPHSCNHGRKMHIIETKYGNDGYAVWFKLLEQLGKANFHFIDISDEMNFMFLTSIFKVEEQKLTDILIDLAKLNAIDPELYLKHKILYSKKFVDSVEDAYKKRRSNVLSISQIIKISKDQSAAETIQSATETRQSAAETPQSGSNPVESIPKEKKSKEKKRKEEEKGREKSPPPSLAFDLLRLEKPSELESFEMQNKKGVNKWKDMIDTFNDTMEIEILQGKTQFESEQLLPRLRKWTRSWINNQEGYSKTPEKNSYESGKIGNRF